MEMIVPVVSIHVGNHAVLEESFEIHSVDDGTPRESFRNTREEWGESSIGFTLGTSVYTSWFDPTIEWHGDVGTRVFFAHSNENNAIFERTHGCTMGNSLLCDYGHFKFALFPMHAVRSRGGSLPVTKHT